MKNTQLISMITLGIVFLIASSNAMAAEGCKGKKKDCRSDTEKFADDYRNRRDQGDTALAHQYQPCRDGGRCGYWGYGYGYGGYYGGSSGASSPGWSRSYWRGSDIPTTGYHYYRGR
jgi:hypothetical protein